MARCNWTYEEEKFVMDNYKKISGKQIAAKLGKTVSAVRNKYNRIIKNTEKLKEPSKPKPVCCPICGKPSNTVTSCINNSVRTVYYCKNCLIEFKGSRLIPPLLNKEAN